MESGSAPAGKRAARDKSCNNASRHALLSLPTWVAPWEQMAMMAPKISDLVLLFLCPPKAAAMAVPAW